MACIHCSPAWNKSYPSPVQQAQLTFHNDHASITLNEEDTYTFLSQLRMEHGIAAPLSRVLLQTFGNENGAALFQMLCEQMGLGYLL